MKLARAAPSLKARALRWLAQREHSRAELRRKLLRSAAADAADDGEEEAGAKVDELLDWLVANRHLDERRFVESRVRVRAERFGTRRIAGELKQHGLALDAATSASLRDSELQRARALWSRRFADAPAHAAERAKQARFLAARGFSGEVIRRLLRNPGAD